MKILREKWIDIKMCFFLMKLYQILILILQICGIPRYLYWKKISRLYSDLLNSFRQILRNILFYIYFWNPCDLRNPNLLLKKSIFEATFLSWVTGDRTQDLWYKSQMPCLLRYSAEYCVIRRSRVRSPVTQDK